MRLLTGLVFGALLAAPTWAQAQAQAPAPPAPPAPPAIDVPPLDAPLPVAPEVRIGTLPNGMRFYIRKNDRPEDRVALRLAVDAGSILEEQDQRGLAHFLEHMAFNGSRNFEPGELVKFLESIGSRFGADANAYTGFDETVYMLDVPTDREGLVRKALLALSDFAGRIDLTGKEVEAERGIVLEEWRLGQGAQMRILRQRLPVLYRGSRYAERLPIGDPVVLRTFPLERLRHFYTRWYHPELMAVVAVGDVDPDEMEREIRKAFADVKGRGPRPDRPSFEIPGHEQTLVNVATDEELTGTLVSLTWKHAKQEERTVGDYRRLLLETVLHQVMSERLNEIAHRPDAPFLQASSSGGELGRTGETYNLMARVAAGGAAAGLRALLVEARRAEVHGFLPVEVERTVARLLAFYDRAWRERDKTESGSYAREYVSNFLTGETIPGIDFERRMAHAFLPRFTAEEVTALLRELVRDDSRVVLVAAPASETAVPTEASLRDVVEAVRRVEVTPWRDELADRPLMAEAPAPGRVVARRRIEEIDVTVVELSNGATVWLKPTDFKNDQVVFSAYARGGASLAPADRLVSARLAATAVAEAGVGGFSPVELEKKLAGRIVGVTPWVQAVLHGVGGATSTDDVETALQLMHLEFTSPNSDPSAFQVLRRRLSEAIGQRRNDPAVVYRDALVALNTGAHPLWEPLEVPDVEGADFAWAVDYYQERFANAADFTFFFVGAFDVDAVVPLLEKYVASLPSRGQPTAPPRLPGLDFPRGTPERVVRLGREPLALTTLTFFAPAGHDLVDRHLARTAASILRTLLRGLLREQLGQAYSASVGWSPEDPLPGYGTLTVSFGSAPENAASMVETVLDEVARLQRSGPPEDAVRNELEIQRRELETSRRQNGWWLSILQSAHVIGADPVRAVEIEQRIDAVTRESIRNAFRRFLPRDRYTEVHLMPAEGAAPAAAARP